MKRRIGVWNCTLQGLLKICNHAKHRHIFYNKINNLGSSIFEKTKWFLNMA